MILPVTLVLPVRTLLVCILEVSGQTETVLALSQGHVASRSDAAGAASHADLFQTWFQITGWTRFGRRSLRCSSLQFLSQEGSTADNPTCCVWAFLACSHLVVPSAVCWPRLPAQEIDKYPARRELCELSVPGEDLESLPQASIKGNTGCSSKGKDHINSYVQAAFKQVRYEAKKFLKEFLAACFVANRSWNEDAKAPNVRACCKIKQAHATQQTPPRLRRAERSSSDVSLRASESSDYFSSSIWSTSSTIRRKTRRGRLEDPLLKQLYKERAALGASFCQSDAPYAAALDEALAGTATAPTADRLSYGLATRWHDPGRRDAVRRCLYFLRRAAARQAARQDEEELYEMLCKRQELTRPCCQQRYINGLKRWLARPDKQALQVGELLLEPYRGRWEISAAEAICEPALQLSYQGVAASTRVEARHIMACLFSNSDEAAAADEDRRHGTWRVWVYGLALALAERWGIVHDFPQLSAPELLNYPAGKACPAAEHGVTFVRESKFVQLWKEGVRSEEPALRSWVDLELEILKRGNMQWLHPTLEHLRVRVSAAQNGAHFFFSGPGLLNPQIRQILFGAFRPTLQLTTVNGRLGYLYEPVVEEQAGPILDRWYSALWGLAQEIDPEAALRCDSCAPYLHKNKQPKSGILGWDSEFALALDNETEAKRLLNLRSLVVGGLGLLDARLNPIKVSGEGVSTLHDGPFSPERASVALARFLAARALLSELDPAFQYQGKLSPWVLCLEPPGTLSYYLNGAEEKSQAQESASTFLCLLQEHAFVLHRRHGAWQLHGLEHSQELSCQAAAFLAQALPAHQVDNGPQRESWEEAWLLLGSALGLRYTLDAAQRRQTLFLPPAPEEEGMCAGWELATTATSDEYEIPTEWTFALQRTTTHSANASRCVWKRPDLMDCTQSSARLRSNTRSTSAPERYVAHLQRAANHEHRPRFSSWSLSLTSSAEISALCGAWAPAKSGASGAAQATVTKRCQKSRSPLMSGKSDRFAPLAADADRTASSMRLAYLGQHATSPFMLAFTRPSGGAQLLLVAFVYVTLLKGKAKKLSLEERKLRLYPAPAPAGPKRPKLSVGKIIGRSDQPPHTMVDNCEWFPRRPQAPDSFWLGLWLGEDVPAAAPPADVLSTCLDRASEAIRHCVSSISAFFDISLTFPRAPSTEVGRALDISQPKQ
eukprot:g10319.t1